MSFVKKSNAERVRHQRQYDRRVNETQMQKKEGEVNRGKTLDADLVVTESSGTESEKHNTSSRSGNDTHAEDADIKLVNDKEPMDEVQITDEYHVLANEHQHTGQSKPSYYTYMLEKVNSNTTPDSTNISNRGGEIDHNAEKCQVTSPLLDLLTQPNTSEQSYQSFEQHGQILNETSNKAKIKMEIEVHETINIELKHSVAKLLADNEKLHKENEHLKQTYKDLYDSIKKTRVYTKDHNDSLIAQINSKTIENADLKAQIQENVFVNVALKNKLRKLKGNSMDTKFAKPSILGKPILQPPRNQSVVRQPNAFTPHYFPKVREYVLVKPHRVIAPGSSRNSQEESYGSNDMPHNHYIEEARKKAQERNRNSKPSAMHTTSLQNTTNVNSHAKVQSHKTRISNKTVEPKSNTQKSGRQIFTGHRFSPNKSPIVHEKINTPRSCLRWKPTSRIFKTAGLRWIPTGKIFTSSTTKVDSEPLNGSKEDITNPYKCEQTLNVSAGVEEQPQLAHFDDPCHELLHEVSISQGSSSHSWKVNGENQVVSKSSAVTAADASNKRQQQLDSTSSTSTLASSVSADGIFDITFRVMFFSIHGDKWKSFQCQHQTALRSNTSAGNPVKEILLQLNLPDHGSVLTDLKVHINIEMEIPSSSIVKFITTCSFFISKLIKLKNFKKDVSMSFQDKEEFEHVGPKFCVMLKYNDQMGYMWIDDSEKTHDDSSLQNNGTADQQVNTARPDINTGSREVSTALLEVNTATPEDLGGPSPASEDSHMEDQGIELGNYKDDNTSYMKRISSVYIKGKKSSGSSYMYFLFVPLFRKEPKHNDSKLLEILAWGRSKEGGSSSIQTAKVLDSCGFTIGHGSNFEKKPWFKMEMLTDVDELLLDHFRIFDVPYIFQARYHVCYFLYLTVVTMLEYTERNVNHWGLSIFGGNRGLTAENGEDGSFSIPNSEIFEQLALRIFTQDSPKAATWEQYAENQLQQHSRTYLVPSLSNKVFNNMKRPTKGFSGQEVALFPTMLDVTEPSTSPLRITSSPSHSPEPSPSPRKARWRALKLFISVDEDIADDSSKQGRILSDAEVQEKASNETEPVIQDVTPTEVIQDQQSSEKGSAEVFSICWARRYLLVKEVPIVSMLRAQIARDEEIARHWDEEERQRAMAEAKSTKKIFEPMDMEHGTKKMKSPKKIEEEDADTQEEVKEVSKESGSKRKLNLFLEKA
ncbi:hypothetical protein Tco_1082678 [Tanacetum coccineum]|uniref:Uncharacterized protein n=1 Tax=Tanacetum coccineum TaxID=301880 RepID=A0ABQ5I380_9ASTR